MSIQSKLMRSVNRAVSPVIRDVIHASVSGSANILSQLGMNIKASTANNATGRNTAITASATNMSRTLPYDMKPGFRNSPKAHHTKDGGWYVNVPFRHKAASMPRSIYNQARQLDSGESLVISDPLLTSWTGYKHKANKYSGLRRMVNNTYGKYYTFRRVSDKSDPMSWWHPGREVSHPVSVDPSRLQKTVNDFVVANINSALRR